MWQLIQLIKIKTMFRDYKKICQVGQWSSLQVYKKILVNEFSWLRHCEKCKVASAEFFLKSYVILLSLMNNNMNNPKGLRGEWSLLVYSFLTEDMEPSRIVEEMKSSDLSYDRISLVKKELSSKRKKMNQSIEKIKIKIEQVNSVIENLELVGSDTSGLTKEIDFLNNEGEKISEEVLHLDLKIRKLNELQDLLSS